MNIPTAHSNESLERFLSHIIEAPIPKVVDRAYLKEHGFNSGNDPELRHIFRLLGFLDDNDKPKKRWNLYKEAGIPELREAVYDCYKGLFELFPDAYNRSDQQLSVWFRPPITGSTRSSVERSIRTFRKLCQLSETNNPGTVSNPSPNKPVIFNKDSLARNPSTSSPTILIPSFTNKADYVTLFEALREVFYE